MKGISIHMGVLQLPVHIEQWLCTNIIILFESASEHKAIHSRRTPNTEGIHPGWKYLSTKPFMQDNFLTTMQFVQNEASEHKVIYSRRTSNAQGIHPGQTVWARRHLLKTNTKCSRNLSRTKNQSTKPFIQDNVPMLREFVQDECHRRGTQDLSVFRRRLSRVETSRTT